MISPPAGARIWIAAGITDLRRGFTGLSAAVQTVLEQDPFGGQVFVFRGRRGDLIKLLWWDGDGLCLFAKRLERGRFVWPQAESGTVCHLLERSYRCYSKASTGGSRCAPGSRRWQCKITTTRMAEIVCNKLD